MSIARELLRFALPLAPSAPQGSSASFQIGDVSRWASESWVTAFATRAIGLLLMGSAALGVSVPDDVGQAIVGLVLAVLGWIGQRGRENGGEPPRVIRGS